MKTCVSSYSFSNYMKLNNKTQKDIIKLAKDIGFQAIEFTDLCVPDSMSEEEYAQQIREECEKHSLPVINYTIGADFIKCGDSLDSEIQRVIKKADVAKILGASGMRHDATGGFIGCQRSFKTFDQALPVLAYAYKSVTDYAQKIGIVTMIENHGTFCQESARVEKIIGEVGSPNFGWLVDIGNFLCADENPIVAVGKAACFAKHVHVKDFHIKSGNESNPGKGFFSTRGGTYLRGAIVGHGNVPVLQCLRAIKNSGYDGYVSIEFEGMEDNISALEIGLENLNNIIASI